MEREAERISERMTDRTAPLEERQMHASSAGGPVRSAGRPLDSATRAVMEQRLGYDFRHVRVHTDERAARSSALLDARAYTIGRDIVFARGQYTPDTPAGMRLLAHELAHVMQQGREPVPVLRRSPNALKKYTTQQKVGDSDAKAIDLAIDQSKVLARFPPEKAHKAAGHVDTEDHAVFDKQYADYARALGETSDEIKKDLATVGGFTDRKAGQIHLLNHVSDVEALLHEAIHLRSAEPFQKTFGHHLNEGVTEYFTQQVLKEQGLKPGSAYPDELDMANALVQDLGEDVVGQAYFQGKMDAYQKVVAALSRVKGGKGTPPLGEWKRETASADPKDWKKAAAVLHAALSGS